MKSFKKNEKLIKTIIAVILAVAVVAGVIALIVNLSDQKSITLSSFDYEVGALDADGEVVDSTASIRTDNYFFVDGLTVKVDESAKVKYQIYFYDIDKNLLEDGVTEYLTTDFEGEIPDGAVLFKVVITPIADKDGEIGFFELGDYAGQITVTHNK